MAGFSSHCSELSGLMSAGGILSVGSAVPPRWTVQPSRASSGSSVDREEELEMSPHALLGSEGKVI